MSNIVEADYTVVQERTLPVIISEIKIIEQHVTKTAIEGAIQIGERLQEAKQLAGHGNFGQWCQENLNYSQDTAQKFMKLAREYGGKNNVLANTAMSRNFSISNALSLLKVPEEDREKFAEEHPVEDMTNKELEEEIRELKEEKDLDEEEIRMLRDDLDKERDRALEAYDREQAAKEEAAHALQKIEDLKRQLDDAEGGSADMEELEKLKAKLEKTEAALAKEKEKLKKEKDGRQAAIDKELKAAGEAMQEQAKKSIDSLQAEVDRLKRREQKAGNESLLKFKILVDQLQDIFDQAGQCILIEQDAERAHKMNAALRQVVDKMKEEL